MINSIRRALVLAPHTDDAELGAGGLLSRLTEQGADITYVAFSLCEESLKPEYPKDTLKHEMFNAVRRLNVEADRVQVVGVKVREFENARQHILQYLIDLKKHTQRFDVILTPSTHDIHQDHIVVTRECIRAFKDVTILGYELPWNNLTFSPTLTIQLSDDHLRNKIEAVMEYKSQAHRPYLSEDFITSHARSRGVLISECYAEAFEVIRWIIR
jgi:N-acetylglucosamine malate deacetylase 1